MRALSEFLASVLCFLGMAGGLVVGIGAYISGGGMAGVAAGAGVLLFSFSVAAIISLLASIDRRLEQQGNKP